MSYPSKSGKPFEEASKASHSTLVNQALRKILNRFAPISYSQQALQSLFQDKIYTINQDAPHSIEYVISCDSGLLDSLSVIKKVKVTKMGLEIPRLAVMKVGCSYLKLRELQSLKRQTTISQAQIKSLTTQRTLALIIPMTNIAYQGYTSLSHSFRHAINDFFTENGDLLATLRWLLYEEYAQSKKAVTLYGTCSPCNQALMLEDGQTKIDCSACGQPFFLTDILQLHVDIEKDGAVKNDTIKQLLHRLELIYLLRYMKWGYEQDNLAKFLFLSDGQLAIYGLQHIASESSLLSKVRRVIRFLQRNGLNLIAVEKNGEFMSFAEAVGSRQSQLDYLRKGQVMLLDNQIIYQYIKRRDRASATTTNNSLHGRYTHFGSPIIYKSTQGNLYSLTVAPHVDKETRQISDFSNLNAICQVLDQLKCDRYHNALLPITLVNQLVSISAITGRNILTQFFTEHLGKPLQINLFNRN